MNILIQMNALPVYYILCQACVVSALCIPPLQLKERILKSFIFECLNTVHLKRSQSKFYKMFQNLNFAEHWSCLRFICLCCQITSGSTSQYTHVPAHNSQTQTTLKFELI